MSELCAFRRSHPVTDLPPRFGIRPYRSAAADRGPLEFWTSPMPQVSPTGNRLHERGQSGPALIHRQEVYPYVFVSIVKKKF
jgi:hypothetical protein